MAANKVTAVHLGLPDQCESQILEPSRWRAFGGFFLLAAHQLGAGSHADRELRTAEVMGDLLSIERDEGELAWLAQAQGLPIEHRSDISPIALLGLRLTTAPRADASPETSPGLSWPWRR